MLSWSGIFRQEMASNHNWVIIGFRSRCTMHILTLEYIKYLDCVLYLWNPYHYPSLHRINFPNSTKQCESSLSFFIKEIIFKTVAFDLNLFQVAINLGWIRWKQLFRQLLQNFCHLTPLKPGPQFYSWNTSELSPTGAAVENCFAIFGGFDWKAVREWRTLPWKVLKVRPPLSLRNSYELEIIAEKLIWNGNYCWEIDMKWK